MSAIYLVANQVLGTGFGHLQFVHDPDDIFGNGDETEIEVQSTLFGSGDWSVEPVKTFSTGGQQSHALSVSLPAGADPDDMWDLLVGARDHFAGLSIDYRLGLFGSAEGQNSNSYITTLAHIAGIDIAPLVATLTALAIFDSFPGVARNVLFDHITEDGDPLPPVALVLAGTAGDDTVSGGDGADSLSAAAGGDILKGFGGSDTLRGQGGNDKIFGGLQRDYLIGGAGDDRLWGKYGGDGMNGGKGDDRMTGGPGRDRFFFRGQVDEGSDRITDFTDGEDLIRIKGLTFDDIAIAGSGGDTLITLNGLTELTLEGVALALIGAEDFVFL